jgi:2-alkyl-3-oxoalkanoate reductase
MQILVTGATGFLGGVAARELARAGHSVTGSGRDPAKGLALEQSGVRFLAADLRQPGAADRLLGQVTSLDAVLHCAARSSLWGSWSEFLRDNVEISADVAWACSARGVKLVHISSPSVYNATGLTRQVPESTVIGPRFDSLYARSKYLAEQQVRLALPTAVVLRPRGIYGPGDPSIVPHLIRALRTGRLPRLCRSEVDTELTHVLNVAHAARLALERPTPGLYNVSDGETTPIWATIDRLADKLGLRRPTARMPAWLALGAATLLEGVYRCLPAAPEPPVTASALRLLTRPMSLDLRCAREYLGYAPIISPQAGLKTVLDGLGR